MALIFHEGDVVFITPEDGYYGVVTQNDKINVYHISGEFLVCEDIFIQGQLCEARGFPDAFKQIEIDRITGKCAKRFAAKALKARTINKLTQPQALDVMLSIIGSPELTDSDIAEAMEFVCEPASVAYRRKLLKESGVV